MNKKRFTELAYKTKAEECNYFDWCFLLKECCSKNAFEDREKGEYKPCLVMKNKKCDYYETAIKPFLNYEVENG